MSGDLIEFLNARHAEEERDASGALGHSVFDGTGIVTEPTAVGTRSAGLPSHVASFIAHHDPARVLRRVEAERRIIDRHSPLVMSDGDAVCSWCRAWTSDWPCPDLLDLAAPYARPE